MASSFKQLTKRYDNFKEERQHLEEKKVVEKAQNLLNDIRDAGENIGDPEQRSILSNLARDLGEIIFDISDIYPSVRLKSSSQDKSLHLIPSKPGLAIKNFLLVLASQIPVVGIAFTWWSGVLKSPLVAAGLVVGYEGIVLFWNMLGRSVWDSVWEQELKPQAVKGLTTWLKVTVQNLFSDFHRRYKQQMFYEHRGFYTRGLVTSGGYDLEITQVFVELQLGPSHPFQASINPLEVKTLSGNQSIWKFLRQFKKQKATAFTILGPPGSGKTTLLKHIALTFATKQHRRYRLPAVMPVLLFLREHVKTIIEESLPLADLAQQHFADRKRYPELAPPPRWFSRQLEAGKCVVLLDGLDEVVDAMQRQVISAWVDQQIQTYPRCHFLLTARPQGYRDAPLTRTHVLEVLSFTTGQVEQFIRNWYLAVKITAHGGKDDPGILQEATREAQDLLGRLQDQPRMKELTVNPLLLTMIATVHNYRGALPEKRVELYAEICDVLLAHWQRAKGIGGLTARQKRVVLQPLAEAMMEQKVRDMATQKTLEIITPYLKQVGVAESDIDVFLENVQASSGMLVEREAGVWGFARLTFQEYLCAAHWQETGKTAQWEREQWQSFIDDGWWHEVLRLYGAQSDATSLVGACLQRNTRTALALAQNIANEALKLENRDALTETITKALTARPVIQLRSDPLTMSKEKALEVFGLHVQKDAELGFNVQRPLEYIQNDYEDQGEVVIDYATGLMWYKSGSDKQLTYRNAQAYVEELNHHTFTGYDDWRLPTIPELMSLLEPEKQSNELYINPIFDNTQRECWSADRLPEDKSDSSGSVWSITFDGGSLNWGNPTHVAYVRCVRSLKVTVKQPNEHLDRIERAQYIIQAIEETIEERRKNKTGIEIRIRAAFTSMSNIAHHYDKEIPGLLPEQKEELDRLQVKERDSIIELLELDDVKLKCICWPKLHFLKDKYYTRQQKQERVDRLRSFLNNSLEKKYIKHRQVICDNTGGGGNQLIIGNKVVIRAYHSKSGDWSDTSIIKDQQKVDKKIIEYDDQFNRIIKNKNWEHFKSERERNEKMLQGVLKMLDEEVKKTHGS